MRRRFVRSRVRRVPKGPQLWRLTGLGQHFEVDTSRPCAQWWYLLVAARIPQRGCPTFCRRQRILVIVWPWNHSKCKIPLFRPTESQGPRSIPSSALFEHLHVQCPGRDVARARLTQAGVSCRPLQARFSAATPAHRTLFVTYILYKFMCCRGLSFAIAA